MAIGRATSRGGGVIDEADVRGGGDYEWASLIGVAPDHPLVGGTGPGSWSGTITDENRRIVTTPAGQSGAATGGGLAALPDGYRGGVKHLDDWRDLLNFKGSPMPWLLIVALGVLFFAHASVQARAGAFGRKATATAALG